MDRIKELRDKMIRDLSTIYPENESINLANWLFSSIAGIEKKDFSLDPGRYIEPGIIAELKIKHGELMLHKPIQYITGTAYFHDLVLKVDPSVLIPRPETEELVKWVANDFKNVSGLKILDIGTGSGCIVLALGRLLADPVLTAIDISQSALDLASLNAESCSIKVEFIQKDILDEKGWSDMENFDLIVSNPPYVREFEKSRMQANVLDYEPHLALFVPDQDPLLFHRAIAKVAQLKLAPSGKLYLEINESLGREIILLLQEEGFTDIMLKKDMQGKDRMIRAGF